MYVCIYLYVSSITVVFSVSVFRANVTSLQGGGQGVGVAGSVVNQGNLQQATVGGTYLTARYVVNYIRAASHSLKL